MVEVKLLLKTIKLRYLISVCVLSRVLMHVVMHHVTNGMLWKYLGFSVVVELTEVIFIFSISSSIGIECHIFLGILIIFIFIIRHSIAFICIQD